MSFQQAGLRAGSLTAAFLCSASLSLLTAVAFAREGRLTAKRALIAAAAGVVPGIVGFEALLRILDGAMLNGLSSHLALFTVCLVLKGVVLPGLLLLLLGLLVRTGKRGTKRRASRKGDQETVL